MGLNETVQDGMEVGGVPGRECEGMRVGGCGSEEDCSGVGLL